MNIYVCIFVYHIPSNHVQPDLNYISGGVSLGVSAEDSATGNAHIHYIHHIHAYILVTNLNNMG